MRGVSKHHHRAPGRKGWTSFYTSRQARNAPNPKGHTMSVSHRKPQVCVLGSAEPGSRAYELAAAAGEALAKLGITLVSGCGSPATRVAAERAIQANGLVLSIVPPDHMPPPPTGPRRLCFPAAWAMHEISLWLFPAMPASSSAVARAPSRRFIWPGCTSAPCCHSSAVAAGPTNCPPILRTSERTPGSCPGARWRNCKKTSAVLA